MASSHELGSRELAKLGKEVEELGVEWPRLPLTLVLPDFTVVHQHSWMVRKSHTRVVAIGMPGTATHLQLDIEVTQSTEKLGVPGKFQVFDEVSPVKFNAMMQDDGPPVKLRYVQDPDTMATRLQKIIFGKRIWGDHEDWDVSVQGPPDCKVPSIIVKNGSTSYTVMRCEGSSVGSGRTGKMTIDRTSRTVIAKLTDNGRYIAHATAEASSPKGRDALMTIFEGEIGVDDTVMEPGVFPRPLLTACGLVLAGIDCERWDKRRKHAVGSKKRSGANMFNSSGGTIKRSRSRDLSRSATFGRNSSSDTVAQAAAAFRSAGLQRRNTV